MLRLHSLAFLSLLPYGTGPIVLAHEEKWEQEVSFTPVNAGEKQKVELADKETVKGCVDDLRNMLEDSTITERKSFIKSFVREVRVTGSQVSLYYRPPLLSGMMSKETVLVPPIVHDGGRYWT